ncbi:hypothetical protein Peur_019843 [Populus x canadensis]
MIKNPNNFLNNSWSFLWLVGLTAGVGPKCLFAYIQGNNDQAANINMTAPVRVDMFPSTGSSHNTTLIMHFYWPPSTNLIHLPPHQAHPMKQPKHRYAAFKRFGGLMNDSNIHEQVPLGIINSEDTVSFL